MCGGGGSPPAPEPMLPSPALPTPAPVRDIPTPERIADETEDPNLITGKKRKKLKVEQIRKGTKGIF